MKGKAATIGFLLLIFLQHLSIAWKPSSSMIRAARHRVFSMKEKDVPTESKSGAMWKSWSKTADLRKIASAALLSTALLSTQLPTETLAVPSGSRSGGSSFRSSSSYRPSSRLNSMRGSYSFSSPRSYSSSTTIVPVPTAPLFSPFGFGFPGFGFGWGYGISPFSLFNPSFLLLAGLGFAAYTLLKNRVGGSDFIDDAYGDIGSLGEGATVVRLQVALDDDWMRSGNVMQTFAQLASRRGVVTGRTEIAELLSEASLALLRKQSSWVAAAVSGERFRQAKASKAEPLFQQLAVQERAKFEKETTNRLSSDSSSTSEVIDVSSPYVIDTERQSRRGKSTKAVVSIVAAIRGQSQSLNYKDFRSVKDVASCLQALASEALTDEGENVLAVEVLWTPSESGEVLSEKEMIADYPELRSL